MNEAKFLKAYQENMQKFGKDNPKSLLTPEWDRFRQVYFELLKHIDMEGKTLIDIGCGYGGFVEFLYKVVNKQLDFYAGVDIFDECVVEARERVSRVNGMCPFFIVQSDILDTTSNVLLRESVKDIVKKSADVVIALEVLSTMTDPTEFIDALWDLGTEYVVFSVLTPYTYKGSLHAHDPATILNYSLTKTNNVKLVHDKDTWYLMVLRRESR